MNKRYVEHGRTFWECTEHQREAEPGEMCEECQADYDAERERENDL